MQHPARLADAGAADQRPARQRFAGGLDARRARAVPDRRGHGRELIPPSHLFFFTSNPTGPVGFNRLEVAVGYAHPEALVSTEWVAQHRNDPGLRLIEVDVRSEERRVGKECRCRWWPRHEKKKVSDSICKVA